MRTKVKFFIVNSDFKTNNKNFTPFLNERKQNFIAHFWFTQSQLFQEPIQFLKIDFHSCVFILAFFRFKKMGCEGCKTTTLKRNQLKFPKRFEDPKS
jgi:hypothetical protein